MVQATSSAALWRWAAICGLISGLASLIRPISVFTGVVLAISAWYALRRTFPHGHRAAMVLLVCGVNLLVVLPWELEVHSKKGGWPLLADNGGISFLQGMTFGLEKPDLKASPVSADVRALMERADAREREIRTIGGLLRFLAEEAVRNPATFAKLMWLKTTRVWYATHSTRDKETSTILIQAAFLTLACAGLWKLRTRAPAEVFGITMFTLYFWAMSALVLPLLRYMVPVTVVLTVGVGAIFVFLEDWVRSPKPTAALSPKVAVE
jgi:hypothetical protein